MNKNRELEQMMRMGKILDTATKIVCEIVQFFCIVGAALLVIGMLGLGVRMDPATMELAWFGKEIVFESLSGGMQILVIIGMVVICVFAFVLVGDLSKALRSVFQAVANGRPFEESSVKGFRRTALWSLVIGILTGKGAGIVVAIACLLLAYIFHYGVLLQQESDETL
ncbi:MAG: hypothetical protein Q4B26_18990 [Eubacteriales bacterium]|nr:hypothetical protein [Eubacteriales bacterium]